MTTPQKALLAGVAVISLALIILPFTNVSLVSLAGFTGVGPQERVDDSKSGLFTTRAQEEAAALAEKIAQKAVEAAHSGKGKWSASKFTPAERETTVARGMASGGITSVDGRQKEATKAEKAASADLKAAKSQAQAGATGAQSLNTKMEFKLGKNETKASAAGAPPADTQARAPRFIGKSLDGPTDIRAGSIGGPGVHFGGVGASQVAANTAGTTDTSSYGGGSGSGSASAGSASESSSGNDSSGSEGASSGSGGNDSKPSSSGGGGDSSGGGGGGLDQDALGKQQEDCEAAKKRNEAELDEVTERYKMLRTRHEDHPKSCNRDWTQYCSYNQCTQCVSNTNEGYFHGQCGEKYTQRVCNEDSCWYADRCTRKYSRWCWVNSNWCDTKDACKKMNELRKEVSDACGAAFEAVDCNQ